MINEISYLLALGLIDHISTWFSFLCYIDKCNKNINSYVRRFKNWYNANSVNWEDELQDLNIFDAWFLRHLKFYEGVYSTVSSEVQKIFILLVRPNLWKKRIVYETSSQNHIVNLTILHILRPT